MTFKLNLFQEQVLSSESRVTILSTQPGAGLTTALLLKGIKDSLEFHKPFMFFVTHLGNKSAEYYAKILSSFYTDVKVSNKSKIITVKIGNRKVKIKCLSDASEISSKFIPVICIDSSRTGDLFSLFLISGKLNFGGNGNYFNENLQTEWLKSLENSQKDLVTIVRGSTIDNLQNLGSAYYQTLQQLPENHPMFDNSFTLKG